jgi:hypothetical protein
MQKRLDAFNKVADKKSKIDVKKAGSVKKAYAKLLELLVDQSGEIAEWGVPYIREASGWCSGVEMLDHKIKGSKAQAGKCAVTGKVFEIDDENNFIEQE